MKELPRKKQTLVASLNSAVEGFIYVLRTQRNMRLHFLVATLVLVLGIYLNIAKIELLILFGAIVLVLALEMLNTASELVMDVVEELFHPVVKIIKDVTAGAVFLAAINAVAVGYVVFWNRFPFDIQTGIYRIRQSQWHVTLILFIILLFIVVAGKVLFHRGTPFRGGMPSGHAAFAFSLWAIITLLVKNNLVIFLSFIMAFLIARHRIKDNVHTIWEVAAGAILGILTTFLVFQIFF